MLPWKEGLWRRWEFEPRETVGKCDYDAVVLTAQTATTGAQGPDAEAADAEATDAEAANAEATKAEATVVGSTRS